MVGKICGTGSYIPGEIWDNDRLSQMVETSDEWIRERTGVRRRHIAKEEETTAYMAARAAEAALKDAGMEAEEVDLILVATVSAGMLMPGTAFEVQKELKAVHATCMDLNAACTGFLYALNTAQAYIGQKIYRNVLVIGAERLSSLINWKDRSSCILFGDGAGAVVLQAQKSGVYAQVTHSIGSAGKALMCTSRNQKKYEKISDMPETYIQMDGGEVFKFAVSKVPEVIRELLEKEKREQKDIAFFLLHQANERIVRSVARRLGEDIARFPMNMMEYGNTSSASIPILLDEVKKKKMLKSGDLLILAGFGAGLSYGASLIRW